MHTTTLAKIAVSIRRAGWSEGAPASLTSLLAVAQPLWALHSAVKRQSKTWPPGGVLAPSARPFNMLVASDVSQRSCGLVP